MSLLLVARLPRPLCLAGHAPRWPSASNPRSRSTWSSAAAFFPWRGRKAANPGPARGADRIRGGEPVVLAFRVWHLAAGGRDAAERVRLRLGPVLSAGTAAPARGRVRSAP